MLSQSLRILQLSLIQSLLNNEDANVDRYIDSSHNANKQHTGWDIYKNAYHIRLRETIETDHDVLWSYLGDKLFTTMVTGYIKQYPSKVKSLRYFADSLPRYLGSTQPFKENKAIAELALFERTLLDVFDAADNTTFNVGDLQKIPVDDWPTLQITFQTSMHLFKVTTNCVEIWQALKAFEPPPQNRNLNKTNIWLLWRNGERLSEFTSINEDEHQLMLRAMNGDDFSDLCELIAQQTDSETAGETWINHLVTWLNNDLIVNISEKIDISK